MKTKEIKKKDVQRLERGEDEVVEMQATLVVRRLQYGNHVIAGTSFQVQVI